MSLFRKTLWLVCDDDRGFCNCREGVVDAPWLDRSTDPASGPGYMFTCVTCGGGFEFAKAARIRRSLEDLAAARTPRVRRLVDITGKRLPDQVLLATPADWLALARPLQDVLTEGQRYVFFDGHVLPAIHGPVKFKGMWRSHDLPNLPHLSRTRLAECLGDGKYWRGEDEGYSRVCES